MLVVAVAGLEGLDIRPLSLSPVTARRRRPRPRDNLKLRLELLGIPGTMGEEEVDELARAIHLLLLPLQHLLEGQDQVGLALLMLPNTLHLMQVRLRPP